MPTWSWWCRQVSRKEPFAKFQFHRIACWLLLFLMLIKNVYHHWRLTTEWDTRMGQWERDRERVLACSVADQQQTLLFVCVCLIQSTCSLLFICSLPTQLSLAHLALQFRTESRNSNWQSSLLDELRLTSSHGTFSFQVQDERRDRQSVSQLASQMNAGINATTVQMFVLSHGWQVTSLRLKLEWSEVKSELEHLINEPPPS